MAEELQLMLRALFVICALVAGGHPVTAAEKARVFFTESGTPEISAENIRFEKGTSPENIEVMKSFLKLCPDVAVTSSRDRADYVVRFDRETPSPVTPFIKGNKVAIFDRQNDLVYAESSRYLSGAVKGSCSALLKHAASSR